MTQDIHEPGSSDRSFGLTFAAVFAILGLLPLLGDAGSRPVWWLLAFAAAFLAVSLTLPQVLRPLNRLWFRFGMLLNRIMSPVIITLLYCLAIVPVGLLMRLFGKDPIRLRARRGAATHWIERSPPGPEPESLKEQF